MTERVARTIPGILDRYIMTDNRGKVRYVSVRLGCVVAILARPGSARNLVLMPPRSFVNDHLAELDGSYGGILSMAFDQTMRELREAGFRIELDQSREFLRCTEKGKIRSPICHTPLCPWSLRSEVYALDECPMDHWKLYHS